MLMNEVNQEMATPRRDQNGSASRRTITGRLEELNGHGSLTGRLWEADGTKWHCRFRVEHLEQLTLAWMRTAKVIGRAIIEEGRERILEVESLVVLANGMEACSADAKMSFWKSVPLHELAIAQRVLPASDLDEFSKLWPVDDDPDDLLRHVLNERLVRRELANEEHPS